MAECVDGCPFCIKLQVFACPEPECEREVRTVDDVMTAPVRLSCHPDAAPIVTERVFHSDRLMENVRWRSNHTRKWAKR